MQRIDTIIPKISLATIILILSASLSLHGVGEVSPTVATSTLVGTSTPLAKVSPVITSSTSPSASKSAIYDETLRIGAKYHLDTERFSKVIFCESGYNPKALNSSDPYGGSRGVGQFLQPTFDHYKKLAGLPDGDVWNYKDSIEVMGYMWSINQQRQWSVWRILYGDMQYLEKQKADCEASYSRFLKTLQ